VVAFIYNKDLGELILWILFNYSGGNIILSVDEKDEISIRDVALLIAREFEYDHKIVFEDIVDKGQYKKTADNSLLRNILPNYNFIDIKTGLKETIDWFKNNYSIVRK
jgi:GDP-L-fucose synthase